jgi:GAF domain-containing protein
MTDLTEREQALAATFVALADILVEDYDLLDLLDRLVAACVDLLGASAAGLLLDDQKGNLSVVASSSEETRMLEVFQLQANEGPCLDCVRTGQAVSSDDLHAEQQRWPRFAPVALDVGFSSVSAVPMRLRDETIGGLNLFHSNGDQVGEHERKLAQALAHVATIGILQQRSASRASTLTDQLQHALNSRVVIEQAKGVLAERHGVSMGEAFDALRRHSRNHNVKLTEHARSIVGNTNCDH